MMTLIFYLLCAHSDTLKNMHSYQIQGVLTTLAQTSICEQEFYTYLKKNTQRSRIHIIKKGIKEPKHVCITNICAWGDAC